MFETFSPTRGDQPKESHGPAPPRPPKPGTDTNFHIPDEDANPDPQGHMSQEVSPEQEARLTKMMDDLLSDDGEKD
ncbi:hypothetical protein M3C60_006215 [Micrococcus luteus]|nr:hypothetical protein [Micrococcus luteus]MCV7467121.1 hypothetical protein [Micrococcus luteus]